MMLNDIAAAVSGSRVLGEAGTRITSLGYDSRATQPGALFFCVPGERSDGHDFAAAAVAAGAAALVVERALDLDVPQIVVPSARDAMGPMSAAFFEHPSHAMTVVGVTGTNGKTTTAFMLESVFRARGVMPGLIGTVETHVGGAVLPGKRTTPEAADLQSLLAQMRDTGVKAVGMEVSSHGLDLGRVSGTRFACAIFTNLTQDHLDYHETMESYFEAKAAMFSPEFAACAVVNADDEYGRRLIARTTIPVVTFSMHSDADVCALSFQTHRGGSDAEVDVAGARVHVRVPIPARYNVANALGVIGAGHALGWPIEDVVRGIETMGGVPGRVEPVDAGQDFTVLVDYAHTPDSLGGVLQAARELTPDGARLVVVFGCGGNRDRGKRPQMGRIAAELADRAIITSDNPRSEDPQAIMNEIEVGARQTGALFEAIVDRREAIAAALRDALPGDVIVIAGKGHESGQEFADRTIPFDDRAVARAILEDLCSRSR